MGVNVGGVTSAGAAAAARGAGTGGCATPGVRRRATAAPQPRLSGETFQAEVVQTPRVGVFPWSLRGPCPSLSLTTEGVEPNPPQRLMTFSSIRGLGPRDSLTSAWADEPGWIAS